MWRRLCRLEDVPQNGLKEFTAEGGPRILIARTATEYFAYQADCPHEAFPLDQGIQDGSVLTCLEHLWQFDVRTGAPLGDAECGLTTYRVKEEEGALHVWIDQG